MPPPINIRLFDLHRVGSLVFIDGLRRRIVADEAPFDGGVILELAEVAWAGRGGAGAAADAEGRARLKSLHASPVFAKHDQSVLEFFARPRSKQSAENGEGRERAFAVQVSLTTASVS